MRTRRPYSPSYFQCIGSSTLHTHSMGGLGCSLGTEKRTPRLFASSLLAHVKGPSFLPSVGDSSVSVPRLSASYSTVV